jgi:hypothetical protein
LKKQILKNNLKKYRFEKKDNQIWHTKKMKPIHKGWHWKIIPIKKKKIRTTKKKNKDHIWYKNKMSKDEIRRQINSIKDSRQKNNIIKKWGLNLI